MDAIEQEIQAKGLTAPRVTPEDLEAEVIAENYFTARHGVEGAIAVGEYCGIESEPERDGERARLGLLTFCVLVLRNGLTVTGESACVSPENFNPEIGRKIARQHAIDKLWPLLGFRLADKLTARAEAERVVAGMDD